MSRESATTGSQGVEEWCRMLLASWPTGSGAWNTGTAGRERQKFGGDCCGNAQSVEA
ncbi:hypothetical protein DPMN_175263 [Dreissena polymorpha]|uniref:Uncharacterized protein n=1 Tax=Dreissena polymorpha TaxID=45954 RepID=A0A9D4E4W2_DREPO|nr:hypothetical protein DPMN_175263 [Dreissena polymorpha]